MFMYKGRSLLKHDKSYMGCFCLYPKCIIERAVVCKYTYMHTYIHMNTLEIKQNQIDLIEGMTWDFGQSTSNSIVLFTITKTKERKC